MLGEDERTTGRAGIAQSFDVTQDFFVGYAEVVCDVFQDAQISLMSDEVAEIVERIASLFQQAFGIFRHVRARLYEDVFAFGHTDSPVARTQLDAFRAFPERTERLGVNLQHFVVLFMYAFVRNKESHGRVAPKVAGLRIVLILYAEFLSPPIISALRAFPQAKYPSMISSAFTNDEQADEMVNALAFSIP